MPSLKVFLVDHPKTYHPASLQVRDRRLKFHEDRDTLRHCGYSQQMSTKIVARVGLAAVLLFPIAGVVATPAAAEPPTTPCSSEWQIVDPVDPLDLILQPQDSPTTSCESDKQACMSGSVQTGIYGEQYVPPDAVAMCMDAYRACLNNPQ